MVERVVLPELGRALAFAADCRIEQVISRYEKQAVGLSFSPALTTLAHGVTSLPIKQALDDSLLLVTSTDDGDGAGRLAAWGCGNYRYVGGGRNVAWSGDVFTAHAGADMQLGSTVLAGVSVSRSMGSFDYDAGNISGDYELRMTGVHPYLAWSVSSLNVWATVGHGRGELRFVDNVRPTTLNSSMVGVSGRLLAREGHVCKWRENGPWHEWTLRVLSQGRRICGGSDSGSRPAICTCCPPVSQLLRGESWA